MSIFSKILKIFTGKVDSPIRETPTAAARRELRSFIRYRVSIPLISILINNESAIAPVDLSYGGFSIPSTSLKTQIHLSQRITSRLRILNQEVTTSAVLTNNAGKNYGFAFLYKTTDALLFMQQIIEFVKRGSSLAELAPENLKDEYKNAGWQYFRGEGPTDLLIRASESPKPDILMTYKTAHAYKEIKSENDRLSTAVGIDDDSRLSSRMKPDRNISVETLREAVYIAMGIANQKLLRDIRPFCELAIAEILSQPPKL